VALGLPWLSSLAQAQPVAPKRLAILWQNNGTNTQAFWPTVPVGDLTDAHFEAALGIAPLKELKSKVHLVRGMDLTPTGGHLGPLSLTATPAKAYSGLAEMEKAWAQGPSLDQVLAPKVNPSGRGPLLLRTSWAGGADYVGSIYATLSYRAANQPVTHEHSPWRAYRDLIGLGPTPDQQATRLLVERRRSVLDLVGGRLELLRNRRLSAADKSKLDLHFTAVRDLEKSLATQGMMKCELPGDRAKQLEQFPATKLDEDPSFPIINRMHLDVMALTFACDLNRVALLMMGDEAGGPVFHFDGLTHTYAQHPLSHGTRGEATDSGDVPDFRRFLSDIDRWHATQMKYLMQKLDGYTEGMGTLLDQTLVVWMNSMTNGQSHSSADTPIILGGSLGGYFKTGKYSNVADSNSKRKPHNMLLTTILNGFGIQETHFGSKAHGRAGALTSIVV
jgi:hypothetical protein